ALDDHRAVLRTIEQQHASLVPSDFMKQGFGQLWTPAYSLAVRLLLRQGRPLEALETAELGRSRALLDLMASRDENTSGRATLALAVAGSPSAPASFRRSDAVARPARVADLVATAARLKTTLLVYWVDDDALYAWTVAPDGTVHHAVTPLSTTRLMAMTREVTAFTSTAGADDASARTIVTRGAQTIPIVMPPRRAWRELYDVLIAPIASHLPTTPGARLTIVPHGPLTAVPFAALRDARGRYLVERFAVHTAPAGGFFAYTRRTDARPPRSAPALLVSNPSAPPRVPGDPVLPPLPGADAEVRAIARS